MVSNIVYWSLTVSSTVGYNWDVSATGMYELIAANKRNSLLLVALMLLLVAAVAAVIGFTHGGEDGGPLALFFAAVALVVSGLGALISYFTGTYIIMAVSGAHPADPEKERQLHNVVEELCVATGLPKPALYIIEDSAPNAFACGRNPQHSTIAVTRGLLQKLSRNELQGVLAHELAHIQEYDVLFATLLSVLVGMVVLMCDAFWRASWHSARRRSGRSGRGRELDVFFVVVALILVVVAPLFAQIIQLAASRQREYLADATGAKITRDPESLARALEKIASDPEPLEAANRGTQHLYIVNPLKGKAMADVQTWFSTHPPIRERVARLRAMT